MAGSRTLRADLSRLLVLMVLQYMVTTGLLIAEVSINMAKDGHPSGGLISMIRSETD